jgi:hypothetical protein
MNDMGYSSKLVQMMHLDLDSWETQVSCSSRANAFLEKTQNYYYASLKRRASWELQSRYEFELMKESAESVLSKSFAD